MSDQGPRRPAWRKKLRSLIAKARDEVKAEEESSRERNKPT